jgi:mannose/fructose/N-acetylgalactosamine-specific phosphotransferase system component IIB
MNNRHKVKETQAQQLKMLQPEPKTSGYGMVILNKDKFVEVLDEAQASKAFALLKSRMSEVKQVVANPKNDTVGIVNIDANGGTVSVRKDIMLSDIDQILEAQTIERAQYYLRRLRTGINEIKTGKLNEINLRRWKEYDEVLTDSLWVLQKRDNSGAHVAEYWGNFIPQIPRQMMVRYTKKGDWVLDVFAGSGTTLIECRRLGSNGVLHESRIG